GEAVKGHQTTYLLVTPTFLMSYTRRIQREEFSSLKLVVAGAEKLQRIVAEAFEEKFGMRPLEGYGTTELSPVISLNLPDVEDNGFTQIGNKEGSVGHPIPGVAVKTVDPESGVELGPGASGELWVKGPNVMQGYLNDEAKTSEVITEGWYHTGDIGHVDEDGFITIVDRLSRFCKIGGEMVSHVAVEQAYREGLGMGEQVVAVTSVQDASKGEQLAVLYMEAEVDADKLHEIISGSDLPNLWKPRRDHYFKIESMPLLGTGKLDLRALKRLAEEAMAV
ncbi:MAG: AMP-binding protein, partial [Planctomycetes bacterium]|nr:AMP-binding protein [Planctomycetota bacterium]